LDVKDLTLLLNSVQGGEPSAADELLRLVYDEFRLILPWSVAGVEIAAKWAETALAIEPTDRNWLTFLFTKGLAVYRRGDFAAAADWAQKALAKGVIGQDCWEKDDTEKKDWDEAFANLAEAERLLSKRNGTSLRLQILIAKHDYSAVRDLVEKLCRQSTDDALPQTKAAGELNGFAWRMAIDETLSPADLAHAETIAKWADDAAKNKDANIVDTLARVVFRQGKKDEAIALQEKAVKLAHESPDFQKTLESYRKGELPKP